MACMPVSFPDHPPGLKRGLGTRLHACMSIALFPGSHAPECEIEVVHVPGEPGNEASMNNQRTTPSTKYIKLVYSASSIH